MFEEDGDEPTETGDYHGPHGNPETMAEDARNSTMPPLPEGGAYDPSDRASFWTSIAESLNSSSKADTNTLWYKSDGSKSSAGIPGGDLEQHLFSTWGSDPAYDHVRMMWLTAEERFKGAASTQPAHLAALMDLPDAMTDQALSVYGLTAGAIADKIYPLILTEKRKADARYELKAPPAGTTEDVAGKWGDMLGQPGKDALAALDKCASQVTSGDYSGCKPGATAIEEGVGADETVRTIGFKEQCFLLSKVSTLAAYKGEAKEGTGISGVTADTARTESVGERFMWKRWPYIPSLWHSSGTNACIQVQSDPFNFINDMVVFPDTQQFLQMPSEEIANLQPIIRLFKIIKGPAGKEIRIPIHFDTDAHYDLVNFMKGGSRNIGVGIQDFQVKFQGTAPFAAKKDLTAKLTIYASSFAELVRPRYTKIGASSGAPGSAGGQATLNNMKKYQYIDLALKTQSAVTKNSLESKKPGATMNSVTGLDFSIRAIIGVNEPRRSVSGNAFLEGALSRNFVTLEMLPTIHSFDFNDDGSVKFEINYKPFVNENFSSNAYDIFATKEITMFLLGSDIISTTIMNNCDIKAAANFKRSQVEKIKEIQTGAIASLLKNVSDQGLMRYLWIPDKLLKKINKQGPLFDFEELVKEKIRISASKGKQLKVKVATAATQSKEQGKKTPIASTAISPNSAGIQFIYLSDLIDVILDSIDRRMQPGNISAMLENMKKDNYGKLTIRGGAGAVDWNSPEVATQMQIAKDSYIKEYANFKRLRIVLGPIELANPINPAHVKIVNLGDLPVSVKYLTEFLTSEVLSKGRRQFPLDQCIDKLINKMISSFLNNDSCFNGSVKQRTFPRRTSFAAYGIPTTRAGRYRQDDPLFAHLANRPDLDMCTRISANHYSRPLIDTVGRVGEQINASNHRDLYMYSVFYTANTLPIGMFSGDIEADSARGVHHYCVGKDSGIIKEVKLVRDKRKGIAEARYAQDGFNGLTQLREMYHVEITTFANMSVYPGMKIFVDPAGWVPKMDYEITQALGRYTNLTDFGIGGYYDIVEVEHFYGPGKFETKFTAKWTAQIATSTPASATNSVSTPAEKTPQKCQVIFNQERGGDAVAGEIPAARAAALERAAPAPLPLPPPSAGPDVGIGVAGDVAAGENFNTAVGALQAAGIDQLNSAGLDDY